MLVNRKAKAVTRKEDKFIVDEHTITEDGMPIPNEMMGKEFDTEDIAWIEDVIPKVFGFDQALTLIKQGVTVGIVGKPEHVYVETANIIKIGAGAFKGSSRAYAPVLVQVDASGVHRAGWIPSQEDMLSDYWEVRIIN